MNTLHSYHPIYLRTGCGVVEVYFLKKAGAVGSLVANPAPPQRESTALPHRASREKVSEDDTGCQCGRRDEQFR